MQRRQFTFGLFQLMPRQLPPLDPTDDWSPYVEAANAFASKFNHGIIDLKRFRHMLDIGNKLDGRRCK